MNYVNIIIKNKEAKNRFDRLPKKTKEILSNCKLVVLDFDGVITNNKVLIDREGLEYVQCDRSDFFGYKELVALGLKFIIISAEANNIVVSRANKLKIKAYHGVTNKLIELQKQTKSRKISLKNTIYVGNDLNDLDCLRAVGLPIAVKDSYPPVIDFVQKTKGYITKSSGGDGAVREILELLLIAKTI
ncbi:MAG: HAD hydrolase family protein [bacterium]|nr:HAD hydrolase family protein [bacterium]